MELRNSQILDLHNQGQSLRQIAEKVNLSKSMVVKILNTMLIKEEPKEIKIKPIKQGQETKFTSFVGWERIDVNVYSNLNTGEVVNVRFIKACDPSGSGYFVSC